jgi:hypothetical protein
MSLDLNFNKELSSHDIQTKTNLIITNNEFGKFIEDEYGNVVSAKGEPIYGITLYGNMRRNPRKILDTLITTFKIKFIDDDAIDDYYHEPELYKNIDLYTPTTLKYGYLIDFNGDIVIPQRNENDYLPYEKITDEPNNNDYLHYDDDLLFELT